MPRAVKSSTPRRTEMNPLGLPTDWATAAQEFAMQTNATLEGLSQAFAGLKAHKVSLDVSRDIVQACLAYGVSPAWIADTILPLLKGQPG